MTQQLFLAIGLCAAVTLPSPRSASAGIVEVPGDPAPAQSPEEFLDELPELAPEEYAEVLAEQDLEIVCVNAESVENLE
jgi:hypothetical protein